MNTRFVASIAAVTVILAAALPLAPRPANSEPGVVPDGAQPDAGAEVVRLDRFRKK